MRMQTIFQYPNIKKKKLTTTIITTLYDPPKLPSPMNAMRTGKQQQQLYFLYFL